LNFKAQHPNIKCTVNCLLRIAVLGGGVSGAAFALAASVASGLDIVVYELHQEYTKPCGEAVPVEVERASPVELHVLSEIKKFEFRVQGETLAQVSFRRPIWYIIDKKSWVGSMLAEAARRGARVLKGRYDQCACTKSADIVVEARGPFAPNGLRKLHIARAIARAEWDEELAVLDYEPVKIGFSWIFPYGKGRVNAGVSVLGVKNPQSILSRLLRDRLKVAKVDDTRTSLITVDGPALSARGRCFPIGEAAGLVHALSGEGIRPSLYHALSFARELVRGESASRAYTNAKREIGSLASQIGTHHRVFKLMRLLGEKWRLRLLKCIDERFVREYVRTGAISWSAIALSLLKRLRSSMAPTAGKRDVLVYDSKLAKLPGILLPLQDNPFDPS